MASNAKTLAKGSLLRLFYFFINIACAFVMMPFIIHSLGNRIYGLWIFIGSFLDFYGLFDLGFASAVQRYVSRAIGNQDHKEANIIINTSLFLFTIIGIVTFLFSIVTAFFVPLFIKNISEVVLFKQIIIILGLSFAVGFPMRVFSGILTSVLRYDVVTVIGILKLTIKTILIFIFLKSGFGVLTIALITLFTDFIFYAVSYIVSRQIANYMIISKELIQMQKIKHLFKYSILTFINQIADKLRFGIDNFVITAFMGLSFVTVYSIASRIALYFIDFIITVIGVLTPVFSQYESKGDYESIREKFILTTKISCYLSILIAGILLIFGNAFIVRWMGYEYKNAYQILIILIIPLTIALMQNPSVQLVLGISKHKFYAVSNSIEAAANLILSILLVKKLGVIGVALGTAIPMIIIKLFVQPLYICKLIKLDIIYYYFNLLGIPLLKSGIIFLILWLGLKTFILPNYFSLLIQITLTLIIFIGSVFFIGLKNTERDYFIQQIIK